MRRLGWWGAAAATAVILTGALALPVVLSADDEGSVGASGSEEPLALEHLPVGAEPRDGYLAGSEFRRDEERLTFDLEVGSRITDLVAMSGGYLLWLSDDSVDESVRFVSDDGTSSRTWQIDVDSFYSALVVSDDGLLGTFVQAGGSAVVIQDGGRTVTEIPPPGDAMDIGFAPVAVSGTDCRGADADCAVVLHGIKAGGGTGTWTVRPGRPAEASGPGIPDLRAVAANGYTAGTVKVIEDGDGSCTGVADTRGDVLWTSCKDRVLSFSPSSRLVMATTSASFGSGDHELTLFDARSGKERLRLRTAENVGIYEMVWEDDDHVLAVVSDWKVDEAADEHVGQRWAVLRIGLDGTREYAVPPVAGEKDDSYGPLDLPQG